MRADYPLLSALLPQRVEPPLQPSAVNPPPLTQLLALPIQQDVPPVQTLAGHDPPHPLSVLIQGRSKPPILPPTVRDYVTLFSALFLRKGVPLCQPSDEPAPLPQLSA